jgi:hypothetical protein
MTNVMLYKYNTKSFNLSRAYIIETINVVQNIPYDHNRRPSFLGMRHVYHTFIITIYSIINVPCKTSLNFDKFMR